MAVLLNRRLELSFATPGVAVGFTIKSENIIAESMVITRSLCDGNFKLGGCIASSFEIQLIDVQANKVQGKKITAKLYETFEIYGAQSVIFPSTSIYPSNDLYPGKHFTRERMRYLFTGTVDTAKRQNDRQIVKITAYDDLYTLGNKNVYTWFYNFALHSPDGKIPDLTSSLFSSQLSELQLNGNPYGSNGNDQMALKLSAAAVKKKFYKEGLLAIDVLRSICELTGGFGYIDEEGKFLVVDIKNNLSHPYTRSISRYESLSFEEYETQMFDGMVLCYGDDKKFIYGRATSFAQGSCYYCKDNVLANCCTDDATASNFGKNLANKQSSGLLYNKPSSGLLYEDYCYRPFALKMDDDFSSIDDPTQICTTLGVKVKIATGFNSSDDIQYVNSFVLKERITGIANLTHEFSAEGEKVQTGYDSEAI